MQYRLPWICYRPNDKIKTGISVNRYGKLQTLAELVKPWVAAITRLRAAKGWTQGELADAAKIRANTLSEAMNGRSPRMDTMEALASALGVPLWALFVDERQHHLLMQHDEAQVAVAQSVDLKAKVRAELLVEMGLLLDKAIDQAAMPPPVLVERSDADISKPEPTRAKVKRRA